MTTVRLQEQQRSSAAIAVDGSANVDFSLFGPAGKIWRLVIERTAGDCVTFDWTLYATESADATQKALGTLDSGAAVVPGAGLDVDKNYWSSNPLPYCHLESLRKLRVGLTANGGAAGGNVFKVMVFVELVSGQADTVS